MNWNEKKDKSGNIIEFNEEKFVNDWWKNLLPKQQAGIYRSIQYEDPIDAWRKE